MEHAMGLYRLLGCAFPQEIATFRQVGHRGGYVACAGPGGVTGSLIGWTLAGWLYLGMLNTANAIPVGRSHLTPLEAFE